MKIITEAFASIFSDDQWFNKVLVGGLYIFLIPFLIGNVMIMGFQVELAKRIMNNEAGMPMWRDGKNIVRNGIRSFSVSLVYAAIILMFLLTAGVPFFSLTAFFTLFCAHCLINPVIIDLFSKTNSVTRCLNPFFLFRYIITNPGKYLFSLAVTTAMIISAALLGWMWIVVGWTLLIFLTMLVQTALFAKQNFQV